MSFQTRDACRLGIDKSYIHELEDAKIHQPVQCVIVVVSAVCGPFSKENRTNNDGRFKLVIKIKVVAATNAYSVAGRECDTVTTQRITGVDIDVAYRVDASCLDGYISFDPKGKINRPIPGGTIRLKDNEVGREIEKTFLFERGVNAFPLLFEFHEIVLVSRGENCFSRGRTNCVDQHRVAAFHCNTIHSVW